jgi:hypothetical protein
MAHWENRGAGLCMPSTMVAQSVGEAQRRGTLPPALRTLPASSTARVRGDATVRSIWVICAFFFTVMRPAGLGMHTDAFLYSGITLPPSDVVGDSCL